jgi:hypothetical protein
MYLLKHGIFLGNDGRIAQRISSGSLYEGEKPKELHRDLMKTLEEKRH